MNLSTAETNDGNECFVMQNGCQMNSLSWMSQFDWLLNCVCQWLHGGVGVVLGVVAGPIASALGRLEQQQPQQPQQVYRVWFSSLLLGCCSFFFLNISWFSGITVSLPGFTGFYRVTQFHRYWLGLYDALLTCYGFNGFLLVFVTFLWVLSSFTGFYWVSRSYIGLYGVLLGLTSFYGVLLGFTGFR